MAAVARAGPITRDCVSRMAVASAPDATTSPPVAKRRRVGMKISLLFLAVLGALATRFVRQRSWSTLARFPECCPAMPPLTAASGQRLPRHRSSPARFLSRRRISSFDGCSLRSLLAQRSKSYSLTCWRLALLTWLSCLRPTGSSWNHGRSSVHLRPAVSKPRAARRACEWRLAPGLQLASS